MDSQNPNQFQEKYFTSPDGLRLYYRDYPSENTSRPPLICLHGLTRNSKDFHQFALKMTPTHRVLSLDMRGRGQSDYDPVYMNYQIPTYVEDIKAFLAHENLSEIIAVGTSMGGLISMTLGIMQPKLMKGIILNDIGPEIDPRGISRISKYVGRSTPVKSWSHAIMAVRAVSGSLFPDYTSEEWEEFTRNCFKEREDGRVIADYDPLIGVAIAETPRKTIPMNLWPLFQALALTPVMALRGENSDILSAETLERMAFEHPDCTAVTIANRAHTPDLREDHSQQEIAEFLERL